MKIVPRWRREMGSGCRFHYSSSFHLVRDTKKRDARRDGQRNPFGKCHQWKSSSEACLLKGKRHPHTHRNSLTFWGCERAAKKLSEKMLGPFLVAPLTPVWLEESNKKKRAALGCGARAATGWGGFALQGLRLMSSHFSVISISRFSRVS